MADDIGEIPVKITGDFSELETALQGAASAATSGGDQIVSALQGVIEASGLAGGDLSLFRSVLEADQKAGIDLAQSLDDLAHSAQSVGSAVSDAAATALEHLEAAEAGAGESAAAAAGQLKELASAGEHSSAAAHEGESAWVSFGETLLELGGISLTAEGLKELATEALSTFANVQKASIALTALTGSSDKAHEAIESLKGLAVADALSFPNLVTAYQRMTAFGFAAEKIPAILQAAADASAATGRNFESVTNSVDRMALSGTVAARQLATLGLTLHDLADALNTTDAGAKQAFKDLDASDRITVITAALQKYQGVAKAVAEGVAGQFQNLKTETEFVFESIGEAIAPAAEALMSFASNVALPAAKIIATAYEQMGGALGTFISSLTATGESLAKAAADLTGFSSTSKETGDMIKQVAQESFVDAFAPGVRVATAALSELSAGMDVLTGRIPGADAMLVQMTNHLHQLQGAAQMGGDAFKQAWNISLMQAGLGNVDAAILKIIDTQEKANVTVTAAKDAFDKLSKSYETGIPLANGYTATAQDVSRAHVALEAAVKAANVQVKESADSWNTLVNAEKKSEDALRAAQATFDAVSSAWNSGKETLNGLNINLKTYADALDNLTKAQQKATGVVQPFVDSAANVAEAVQKDANAIQTLQNHLDSAAAAFEALKKSQIDGVVVPGTQVMGTAENVAAALNKYETALKALTSATDASKFSTQGQTQSVEAAMKNFKDLGGVVGESTVVMIRGTAVTIENAGAHQKAVGDVSAHTDAVHKNQVAIQNNTTDTVTWTDALKNAEQGSQSAAQQILNLGTTVIDCSKALSDSVGATNDEANALLALATAADDASSSMDNLSTKSGRGKGGGAGGGMSSAEWLAETLAFAQTAGPARGFTSINQGDADKMAQELADATGQVVTTLDGTFIPAAESAAAAAKLIAAQHQAAASSVATHTTATATLTTATTQAASSATVLASTVAALAPVVATTTAAVQGFGNAAAAVVAVATAALTAAGVLSGSTGQSSPMITTFGPQTSILSSAMNGPPTAAGRMPGGYVDPNAANYANSGGGLYPANNSGMNMTFQFSGNTIASDSSIQMFARTVASAIQNEVRNVGGMKL